jgi:2-(1,2-epoxy-1,2-dihydrophenyl)acetyl-CoA isomerase
MSLALACDLRVASQDATFSQAFIKIGLSPDGGSTWLLPRAVGASRATFLAMTGEAISAEKAYEWGAIHEVVESGQHLTKAREWASRLAAFSPHALRELKALLHGSEQRTFPAQLQAESGAQMRNVTTAEFRAAVAAFVSRK